MAHMENRKTKALYASSAKIHPRKVSGTFRTVKWAVVALLLAFWHLAPFLRWDRGPGAPDQAILVDMAGRRAYFFFIEIWPQEVYYLTGLLMIAAIGLFLMSALAGRLWCGFACWQTVYTDLFVAVERAIIGDRNARIAFDHQPWSAAKALRKGAVLVVWLAIAASCGIWFSLYFGDALTLLPQIVTGRADPGTYIAIAIVGGGCFLLAGFAREQVCIYMCPYSRFQSAMFDEHSLIITYESWRGEPRAFARPGQDFTGRGHCVDCLACIQCCPTGIDIRNGNQLACIGCGLCIDACDTVMDKFGLPRGLISYDSVTNIQARESGGKTGFRPIRPRTLVYGTALLIVVAAMVTSLARRTGLDVNILHERSPLFVQISNGDIRNGYTYKVLNMVRRDRTFTVAVAGLDGAKLEVLGNEGQAEKSEIEVPPDSVGTFRVYVTAPEAAIGGKARPITFLLKDTADGQEVHSPSLFAGPEQ